MKWVQLSDMNFPVPYHTLELAELKALHRIHQSRTKINSCFMGEVKISDRLTIILLCYYLSSLSQPRSSEEEHSKTIFYLCKTEERKNQLLYIAGKLKTFLINKLSSQSSVALQNEVIVFGDAQTFQKMLGVRCHRFFILTSKRYLEHQLEIRELNYWSKHLDPCMEIDLNRFSHFYRVCKKIDFLFIQTNDVQSLLDDVLTIQISELHIFRAGIECSKLQRYYNFRFDNNKAKALRVNKTNSLQIVELKDIEKIEKQKSTDQNRKGWFVQDYDIKFKELCKRKQNTLCVRAGEYAMNNRLQIDFLQCFFLMHLQTIFYLTNHLIVEYSTSKIDDYQSTEDFIKMLYKNTHLGADVVKKLRKILINFTIRHPPRVKDRQLSTFYLQQVLAFFQKLVLWHDIFDPALVRSEQNHQMINSKDGYYSEFIIVQSIKQIQFPYYPAKSSKEQLIKLTTYDKKILFELLTDNVKSFCCFQNFGYGYSQDYFNSIFKSSISKTLIEEYLLPTNSKKERHSLIEGLIINSTPNDEDLHLNSDKAIKKQELIEGTQKKQKEGNEHYSQIIRSYGVLIHDLCEVVNDGIVVYFPSKEIMKQCRAEWEAKEEKIYERIFLKKKIFQENDLEKVNRENVTQFRKLCDIGRGAVFFLSAQSSFGKYQAFFRHYSKCVAFVGVPYPQTKVEADIKFKQLSSKTHLKFSQFCFQQAMRTVTRCLSNCSNDPNEVKVVLFADVQFKSNNTIGKWLTMIKDGNANTSTVIQNVTEILCDIESKVKDREQKEARIYNTWQQSQFSLT